jgi:hypothetical protein
MGFAISPSVYERHHSNRQDAKVKREKILLATEIKEISKKICIGFAEQFQRLFFLAAWRLGG